jgi:transposase
LPTRLWPLHDGLQPVQSLEPARHLVWDFRGSNGIEWTNGDGGDRQLDHQGTPIGRRRKRGAYAEAIGRSRGGRTTKIHALTDAEGRPHILLLSPGNTHDVMMAPALIQAAGAVLRLIGDKAYDTNPLRELLASKGIEAVIPSIKRRKPIIPHDRRAYRDRNLIERMFGRLKDFRRVATRYDKLARNFLAGVLIAALVVWWL